MSNNKPLVAQEKKRPKSILTEIWRKKLAFETRANFAPKWVIISENHLKRIMAELQLKDKYYARKEFVNKAKIHGMSLAIAQANIKTPKTVA